MELKDGKWRFTWKSILLPSRSSVCQRVWLMGVQGFGNNGTSWPISSTLNCRTAESHGSTRTPGDNCFSASCRVRPGSVRQEESSPPSWRSASMQGWTQRCRDAHLCGGWTSRSRPSAPLPGAAGPSRRAAQHRHSYRGNCTESLALFPRRSGRVARPTQASPRPDCRSLCWAASRAAEGRWRQSRRRGSLRFCHCSSPCGGTATAAAGRCPAPWESAPLRRLRAGRKWWPKRGSLEFIRGNLLSALQVQFSNALWSDKHVELLTCHRTWRREASERGGPLGNVEDAEARAQPAQQAVQRMLQQQGVSRVGQKMHIHQQELLPPLPWRPDPPSQGLSWEKTDKKKCN